MAPVVGAVLLVLAGVAAATAVGNWRLWNALRKVRPTTPERLTAAARAGRLDGRVVAVSGVSSAGPGGFLSSTVNGDSCVWHRHTVHRRQISYRTTERGQTQRRSRRRRVADVASREPFTLWGTAVKIEVQPDAMLVHRPLARGVRVLPGLVTQPFPEPDVMMGATQHQFWHREWILRAGALLFVLGEVEVRGPRVSLRRPAHGPHIISTRSAASVRRRAAVAVLAGLIIAPLAAIAGTIAFVVHAA